MTLPAEILSAFERDPYAGLEAYSRHREAALFKEGADAKDWDGVKRAEGARNEMKSLRTIREQVEKHIAARNQSTG
jgi:hypothetical protein